MTTTATAKHGTVYLCQPLPKDEIVRQLEGEGIIKGNVAVNLDDIIELDIEGFNDIVAEELIGSHVLQEISFKPVDVDDYYAIIFEVSGWVDIDDLDYL